MSFGWLGTFRAGSWKAFRTFILNERRDADKRIAVIEAELQRIGQITVFYGKKTGEDGKVTVSEKRTGFSVYPESSSLAKLFQAYVAAGGNPLDISMFLTPDSTLLVTQEDGTSTETPTQPYGGAVSTQNGVYSLGTKYVGGNLTLHKHLPNRLPGSQFFVEDSRPASLVDLARKWTNQSIREKRNDLEARIIKLCDLREQLTKELDDLSMAVAGTVSVLPVRDENRFDPAHSVAAIIAAIDGVFYKMDPNGTADFTTYNDENLEQYQSLFKDIGDGEEENTAL